MELLQQDNHRLKHELEAIIKERDGARQCIDEVLNDLVLAQMELDKEKQAASDKEAEIAQLKREIVQFSEKIEEQGHGNSKLQRDGYQQQKTLLSQSSEMRDLQKRYDEVADIQRNGTQTQRDMDAGLRAKDKEIQERSMKMVQLETQMGKLQHQLDQARRVCLENQRGWETAEAKVQVLQQASMAQSSQTKDTAELQRLLQFYQTNAEEVSKQAKATMETSRQLEAMVMAKDKELKAQASVITSITQRAGVQQPTIPGTFQ